MSVKEQASGLAAEAQERATEFGRNTEARINEQRKAAAHALDTAAGTLHEAAATLPVGERVTGIGHSAADKMESAADYLGEHDARDMMTDLGRFMKRHPGRSLIAAAAVGFLVGRTFRRR